MKFMSDGEKERFEYYKELRKNPTWGISNSPFWMYNVYDIDVSQEKDELSLWIEYSGFLCELSNEAYRQFAHDASL